MVKSCEKLYRRRRVCFGYAGGFIMKDGKTKEGKEERKQEEGEARERRDRPATKETNVTTSHLHTEIHDQPAVLARLLAQEGAHVQTLAQTLRQHDPRYVLIAARGSSDNAAAYAKYLFGTLVGLPVALATPSLYTLYGRPPRVDGALVIGISQSGQSPDICAVIEHARAAGVPTIAVTNEPGSRLAQAAGEVVQLHAGAERSIAATKTYTAQLMVMAMLAAALADSAEHSTALAQVPEAMRQTLALQDHITAVAERYRYMEKCVVIGRGYNYATALELALKLKELTYVLAEPYSSADFRHGPLALIEDGFPVLVIAPQSAVYGEVVDLLKRLGERGAERLVISDGAEALAEARTPIALPASLPEWLSPFTSIVAGQLFALALTLAKGYQPDHPRGLRKVTETR
jgi:glutamine---fructose-6-phosphate transaminase (isomerizing)